VWFKVTNYGTSALSLWKHVIGIRRFFEYSPRIATGPVSCEEKRAGEREKEPHSPGITRVFFLAKTKLAG